MIRYALFAMILATTLPAHADDLVSTNQVVAGAFAGALPPGTLGNVSVITQSGYGNVARTDQLGTGDMAQINQAGNNFSASILQTSVQDIAVVNQTGNGLGAPPVTVTQTGPGQSITITVHR